MEAPAAAPQAEGSRLEIGKMEFGCKHYRRRCKIRAPCCNEIFHCRHCHNESTKDRHKLCRQDVQNVICLVCDTQQPVSHVCSNCGVNMGEYFCDVCKFFDDDVEKGQYHCDDCGICRVGGRENFFHCKKCGTCYSNQLRDKHFCVENSMRHNCPICYEYLFDSLKETRVLDCGHTIHMDCCREMLRHHQYSCPVCSKLVGDMSGHLSKLDEELGEENIWSGRMSGEIAGGRCTNQKFPAVSPSHCSGVFDGDFPVISAPVDLNNGTNRNAGEVGAGWSLNHVESSPDGDELVVEPRRGRSLGKEKKRRKKGK